MDKRTDNQGRRPRRSKADIEAAIHKAAISQIRKKGFVRALVTDIVKKAKIEPIVFYNRYKNLTEFYDTFVKHYDYWVSDLTRELQPNLSTHDGYTTCIQTLFEALLNDHMAVELLRWEVAEGTGTTKRTAKLREIDFHHIVEQLHQEFNPQDNVDAVAISAIIIAGIYFLILHKDRSTFGGIDLNSHEGKQRITDALAQIGRMLYDSKQMSINQKQQLTACLQHEGLSPEAIERCIGTL